MLEVQLPAIATLTTQITRTSSLQFVNQTPAALSATVRGPATLSWAMRTLSASMQNLDGGHPTSIYGGVSPIDGGTP